MPGSENEIIEVLAEALELAPADLPPNRVIGEIAEWDSIAWLSLIGIVDERWKLELASADIRRFVTVSDVTRHLLTLAAKGAG